MARSWRTWRVKAKSKHVAKVQGKTVVRCIGIGELVLPWMPIMFAVLPTAFHLLCPSVYMYIVFVVLTAIWLRCALIPNSLFFIGVAASEFPFHIILGNLSLIILWGTGTSPHTTLQILDTPELLIVVACATCSLVLSGWWCMVAYQQVMARAQLKKALEPSGISIPSHMSWYQMLASALPFLNSACGVSYLSDIPYATVDGKELLCDVYRPKHGFQAGAPVLLYFHGGAWILGDKYYTTARPVLKTVAAQGYPVVSINYRLAPLASIKDQISDCKRAIHWLRSDPAAAELGIAGPSIVVGGESAGGHLAMCVALTANRPTFQAGFPDVDTEVQGVVDLFGPKTLMDAAPSLEEPPTGDSMSEPSPMRKNASMFQTFLMHCKDTENPELYRMLSPQVMVDPSRSGSGAGVAVPWLGVQGSRDRLVSMKGSVEFYKALASVNERTAFGMMDGAHHGFAGMPSVRVLAVADAVVGLMTVVAQPTLIAL